MAGTGFLYLTVSKTESVVLTAPDGTRTRIRVADRNNSIKKSNPNRVTIGICAPPEVQISREPDE